jgi:hypothetical protein
MSYTPRTDVVLGHVRDERRRQTELLSDGLINFDCVHAHDGARLQVLVEEVGEVARAMMEGPREDVFEELVQVAAVAVACAEGLYTELLERVA